MVCLHGFTDTWRTWDLVLPELERHHDVLAPTLAGHAGGPPLGDTPGRAHMADEVERAMDEAGMQTAHIVGNSLGGFVTLLLAQRGRAASVVVFAPAGGWDPGDTSRLAPRQHFAEMHERVQRAAPNADAIMETDRGRRNATLATTVNYEHIPPELLAHQLRGAAACEAIGLNERSADADEWALDAARIDCPLRIVWGTEDKLLPWPTAAVHYRDSLFPHADWVVLDGVGHCPQLDVPTEAAQLIIGFTG
jgi:pimeloyl-ACP methyl ester carboxylesterase